MLPSLKISNLIRRFAIVSIVILLAVFLLSSCNKEETPSINTGTSESAWEQTGETQDQSCNHKYFAACDPTCDLCFLRRNDAADHTFDSASECETIKCTACGYSREQSHKYVKGVCEKCGEESEEYLFLSSITPESTNMPAIYLEDYVDSAVPISKLEKSNGYINVKLKYVSNSDEIEDFECVSELKIQGSSSAGYPKKNFTVKLFEDATFMNKLKVDLGWGSQSKYCLKANYIDASHARNIIGAKLSSQVVASRANIASGLTGAPNYGLIDGYPILMFVNGEFYGIYTLNIPKDDWLFGMEGGEESKEAILMTKDWSDEVSLKETLGLKSFEDYKYELEHCSTLDDSWVKPSFNRMIEVLNCGDKQRIRNELPQHLDIEAAIDTFLLVYLMDAGDNQSKNILWVTYDGEVWIPSMYDMDATFGAWWDGTPVGEPVDSAGWTTENMYPKLNEDGSLNLHWHASKMFYVLWECYNEEVRARWAELREEIFTVENITTLFKDFFAKIDNSAFIADQTKWKEIPWPTKNRQNMYENVEGQIGRLDKFFAN